RRREHEPQIQPRKHESTKNHEKERGLCQLLTCVPVFVVAVMTLSRRARAPETARPTLHHAPLISHAAPRTTHHAPRTPAPPHPARAAATSRTERRARPADGCTLG